VGQVLGDVAGAQPSHQSEPSGLVHVTHTSSIRPVLFVRASNIGKDRFDDGKPSSVDYTPSAEKSRADSKPGAAFQTYLSLERYL
jgi:hypothetical protein